MMPKEPWPGEEVAWLVNSACAWCRKQAGEEGGSVCTYLLQHVVLVHAVSRHVAGLKLGTATVSEKRTEQDDDPCAGKADKKNWTMKLLMLVSRVSARRWEPLGYGGEEQLRLVALAGDTNVDIQAGWVGNGSTLAHRVAGSHLLNWFSAYDGGT